MSRARQLRRLARAVGLVPSLSHGMRRAEARRYTAERLAVLVMPTRRRLTDREVGDLHQAARDVGPVTFGWWADRLAPLPGETIESVLRRGERMGIVGPVRAIFDRAGVLPRGSRP